MGVCNLLLTDRGNPKTLGACKGGPGEKYGQGMTQKKVHHLSDNKKGERQGEKTYQGWDYVNTRTKKTLEKRPKESNRTCVGAGWFVQLKFLTTRGESRGNKSPDSNVLGENLNEETI